MAMIIGTVPAPSPVGNRISICSSTRIHLMALKPLSARRDYTCEKSSGWRRGLGLCVSATGMLGSLKGGVGLLERPKFDQSQFDLLPEVEEGGNIGRLTDKKGVGSGDNYRVLLIDDARHTESLVEKALPKIVPSITISDARKLFHESRQKGVAIVIITVKEHAEYYAQMMIRCGLRSAIEPNLNMG